MATLLTPQRSGSSVSHYNHHSQHYSTINGIRQSYYPSSPSASEPRHQPHNSPGIARSCTPTQRGIRTPPDSVCMQSIESTATSTFHSLASSSASPAAKPIKGPWTPTEDRRLLSLVNELGAEKWVVIASRLGSRTGKQCRERWHNHVNPVLNKAPFSLEEEEAIERYYAEIGPKWAEIAKKLPGRSMCPINFPITN